MWQRAYMGYYRQALRGRAGASGQIAATHVDWHGQLVQAEARLLLEFHKWLRREELFDIRAELVRGDPTAISVSSKLSASPTTLFLSCSLLEIARLPWETWEIGADLGQHSPVQIVRSPAMIRSGTANRQAFRRGKTRVLAILGDEQGLDFSGDRNALNAQKAQLDVCYVGWQPDDNLGELKERICAAITDPQGWDILFFAGHSNEAALVEGQIAIAPHTTLSIRELTPYLTQAQQRGLQFALFNSCSGLDIANRLVDLGLSQVAIMREPIHNEVAHRFFVQFLHRLAQYEDVQTALQGSCQFLKGQKALTYPSAYLVPSLFRHPDSEPYRIQPTGWRTTLQKWMPRRRQAIAIAALSLISLYPPVQDGLLNQRMGLQARYRNVTGQIPETEPPVFLVQIDDQTLQERRIAVPRPMDRVLLADLVEALLPLNSSVIGLDYLLDRPHPETDATLQQAFTAAVEQEIWLVFAARRNDVGDWLTVSPTVASPNWSLSGNINAPLLQIRPRGWSARPHPLGYQMATADRLARGSDAIAPLQPDLNSTELLQAQIERYLSDQGQDSVLSPRSRLHPVTNFSYQLRQRWLQPLIDYSLPPERVYYRVSAWDLLQDPPPLLQSLNLDSLENQVVIIVPGGYDEAGFSRDGEDNLEPPVAVTYWRQQPDFYTTRRGFTGGEVNAYLTHHFMSGHLVVPVPDFWMVLLAALAGQGLMLWLTPLSRDRRLAPILLVVGLPVAYGWISLQLYISGAILLPWLLPTLAVWVYGVPLLHHHPTD
jgi:hypothetical protein